MASQPLAIGPRPRPTPGPRPINTFNDLDKAGRRSPGERIDTRGPWNEGGRTGSSVESPCHPEPANPASGHCHRKFAWRKVRKALDELLIEASFETILHAEKQLTKALFPRWAESGALRPNSRELFRSKHLGETETRQIER